MRAAAAISLILASALTLDAAISSRKQALITEVLTLTGESDIAQFRAARALAEVFGSSNQPDFVKAVTTLQSSPELKDQVTNALTSLYDRDFSEQQLEQLVAFLKSGVGQRFRQVLDETPRQIRADIAADMARRAPKTVDEARERRTLADIRTIATAVEARATDENRYPPSSTMEQFAQLLEPKYVRSLPRKDAWGNEFRFIGAADGRHYRIISAGPDGKIDSGNVTTSGFASANDDILFQDGQFIKPKMPAK